MPVLLVNTGSPASPVVRDVRRYLKRFLSDPRVIDLPAPLRWLLVHLVILPLRPRRTAAAYQRVWLPDDELGAPLLAHSEAFREELERSLGSGYRVVLAMRYGEPSLEAALQHVLDMQPPKIVVFPMFPHAATATTGSALAAVYGSLATAGDVPALRVVAPFFDDVGFISALAASARPALTRVNPDHVLMSFHGLPERHVRRSDCRGRAGCLESDDCCDVLGPHNRHCYRAQCHETARRLGAALELAPGQWSVGFQSRMGRTPWISPATEDRLTALIDAGQRRVVVLTPSFVADCLETLEEVGIGLRERFLSRGGESFVLAPCLNARSEWVAAAARLVRGDAF